MHYFKILFFLFINLFSVIALCQTDKGNMIISSDFNISSKSNDNEFVTFTKNDILSEKNFTLSPSFGYFVANNFAIGVEFSYFANQKKQLYSNYDGSIAGGGITFEGLETQKVYTIGIFSKNYFPITEKFSFLVKSSFGFGSGKIEEEYTTLPSIPDTNLSIFGIAINPGVIYFVTPKFSIQTMFANLHYIKTEYENKNYVTNINENKIGLSLDSSTLFVGINYHFK